MSRIWLRLVVLGVLIGLAAVAAMTWAPGAVPVAVVSAGAALYGKKALAELHAEHAEVGEAASGDALEQAGKLAKLGRARRARR